MNTLKSREEDKESEAQRSALLNIGEIIFYASNNFYTNTTIVVNKMMEEQTSQAERCFNNNSYDADGFAKCYVPYHRRFNAEASVLQKRLAWINMEHARCETDAYKNSIRIGQTKEDKA